MKKVIYFTLVVVAGMLFLSSCEKDDIGGTATESMAGEWYVTADAIDTAGNVVYPDFFGLGHFKLDTYNTAADSTNEMYINDNDNFWNFSTIVDVDLNAMTFQKENAENEAYDSQLTILNGQILYGAAKTPSGSVADSIVFTVKFSDDTYPGEYGYDRYRVSGYRFTGFTGDK